MAQRNKQKTHIKSLAANAAPVDNDIDIPANKSVSLTGMDFIVPGGTGARVLIFIGNSNPTNFMGGSYSDKWQEFKQGVPIEGPKKIRQRLDNSGNPNPAVLGSIIHLEEI